MGLFLGIDGGGTRTSCLIADEASILGAGNASGSNVVRLGEASARAAIESAIRQACAVAGVDPRQVTRSCVGIAGSARPEVRDAIQRIISSVISGDVRVVGDMVIALESAAGTGPGVVVIAGTGSIAYGRNANSETARAGGWGYAVSDEGSGHWIGRTALAAALRVHDENGGCALLDTIQKAWNLDSFERLVPAANATPPPDFAALLPVILSAAEAGDSTARSVLSQAGSELAALARVVMRRLFAGGENVPVAMSGGVFRHCALVRQVFYNILRAEFPQAVLNATVVEPVRGAVEMARRGLP